VTNLSVGIVWHTLGRLQSYLGKESGQGLAEYTLIIVLVALGCVAALTGFGGTIGSSTGFRALPISI